MTTLSRRVERLEAKTPRVDMVKHLLESRTAHQRGDAHIPTATLEAQLRERYTPLLAAIIAGRKRCGIA